MTATAEKAAPSGAEQTADRGRLEISRTALRRIAEHAADRVHGSARVRRRVGGLQLSEQGASARLTGPDRELRVRLDVALRYPASIRETVGSLREKVSTELGRIAGCRVREVEVTVSALVPVDEPSRVE